MKKIQMVELEGQQMRSGFYMYSVSQKKSPPEVI